MLILVDVIQLIMPKVMQYAIDSLQAHHRSERPLWVAMLIVAGALSMMALRYFGVF